jgi:hypothetical protein
MIVVLALLGIVVATACAVFWRKHWYLHAVPLLYGFSFYFYPEWVVGPFSGNWQFAVGLGIAFYGFAWLSFWQSVRHRPQSMR